MTERSLAPVGEALLHAFAPTLDLDTAPSIDFVVSPDSVVDGVGVTVTDPATGVATLVYVSPGLAAMVGRPADQLRSQPLTALLGAEMGAHLGAIELRLRNGGQAEASLVLRHASGSAVAVHTTHTALSIGDDRHRHRLILVRDLSRRYSERLLADQSAVADSLARGQDLGSLCHQVATHVDAMLDGSGWCWIGVTDLAERLEAVVTAGQDIDVVGRILRLIMGTGDPAAARCVLVENLPADLAAPMREAEIHALWAFPALDTERRQRGALVVAHRTEDIPTDDEIRTLDHLAQVVAAGIDRAAVEATLTHRALHDPLTRLPNRALIVDRLEQALGRLDREPSSLSVILVDIDRFKSLNDTWGPDVGDRVLLEVAGRLLAAVRLGDTVGRISSDQFLMICIASLDFDPSVVARRVIRSMEKPIHLDTGEELRITVSVGVVAVADSAQSATTIIGNAESALASAVDGGRARFALFDKDLQHEALARHELEQDLHTAITEGQLVLHYQPVCDVTTGQMVGAEALVRWDRPGHGLLGPGDFIEVAEETGLIVPLGAWVIEEVARSLAAWPRSPRGRWPVVTVNLSARQLADESLVPMVLETLHSWKLPPVRMGFEVTESMQVDDVEAAVDALNALSALGSRIAIDDFGIGYATLDYLRRFSMADVIKIDRSFVAGLGRSREDTAIVSASMALARSLGLQVVAEGVETIAQLEQLAELGCHYAQGYALSAPVPLDAAVQLWHAPTLHPGRPGISGLSRGT